MTANVSCYLWNSYSLISAQWEPMCRPNALSANCAATGLVLTYLSRVADVTRTTSKMQLALGYLRFVVGLAVDLSWENRGLDLGDMLVDSAGMVTNFQQLLRQKHLAVVDAWRQQWESMREQLSTSWPEGNDQPLPLLDVAMFLTLAKRIRRSQGKQRWKKISGDLVESLLKQLLKGLADVLHIKILTNLQLYRAGPDVQLPSRRYSRTNFISSLAWKREIYHEWFKDGFS